MAYTNEDKIKILEKEKWYCVQGYAMDFESPEVATNVVVSFDEIIKHLRQGPEWHCLPEYGDFFMDIDSAWEEFVDGVANTIDSDDEILIGEYINKIYQTI